MYPCTIVRRRAAEAAQPARAAVRVRVRARRGRGATPCGTLRGLATWDRHTFHMEIPEIENEDEVKSMISADKLVRALSARRRYNLYTIMFTHLWSRLASLSVAAPLRSVCRRASTFPLPGVDLASAFLCAHLCLHAPVFSAAPGPRTRAPAGAAECAPHCTLAGCCFLSSKNWRSPTRTSPSSRLTWTS